MCAHGSYIMHPNWMQGLRSSTSQLLLQRKLSVLVRNPSSVTWQIPKRSMDEGEHHAQCTLIAHDDYHRTLRLFFCYQLQQTNRCLATSWSPSSKDSANSASDSDLCTTVELVSVYLAKYQDQISCCFLLVCSLTMLSSRLLAMLHVSFIIHSPAGPMTLN